MEYIPTIPPLSHYVVNICLYLAKRLHFLGSRFCKTIDITDSKFKNESFTPPILMIFLDKIYPTPQSLAIRHHSEYSKLLSLPVRYRDSRVSIYPFHNKIAIKRSESPRDPSTGHNILYSCMSEPLPGLFRLDSKYK